MSQTREEEQETLFFTSRVQATFVVWAGITNLLPCVALPWMASSPGSASGLSVWPSAAVSAEPWGVGVREGSSGLDSRRFAEALRAWAGEARA